MKIIDFCLESLKSKNIKFSIINTKLLLFFVYKV